MGLMALAVLVPFAVIVGIFTSGSGDLEGAANGETSERKAVEGGASRRRLQTTYDFATQLEMTVCLTEDHTTDSASVSAEQFKQAIITVFNVEDSDLVKVDTSVSRCLVDQWQRRVSVYNTATEDMSAADVASDQVDSMYPNNPVNKTSMFFEDISNAINAEDSEFTPVASDFDLESLGFLVIWLDSSGEVVSSQATSQSKDVVSIGGTDVWWPWWAWLIYAAVVLCCICPMLFFFFKWRRDKEAEMEGFSGAGKDLGTPAPPSATSSNPYGANYASGEEHKNGKY